MLAWTGVVGGGESSRERVAQYVEEVNEISRGAAAELDRLNVAYDAMRRDPSSLPRQEQRLARGERALADLARRVGRLEPPADAAALHERVERLAAHQSSFAVEVGLLLHFLPVLVEEQRKLAAAAAELQRGLRRADTAREQGRAFVVFSGRLEGLAREAEPPAVPKFLRKSQREQRTRIRRIAVASAALGKALAEGREADVRASARDFSKATSAGIAGLERAAVLAYNRELRSIERERSAVENELLRLNRELR